MIDAPSPERSVDAQQLAHVHGARRHRHGGTSVLGGERAVWRSVVGVLFIALIGNGYDLLGLDPLYEQITLGALMILAVGLDAWSRRRAGLKRFAAGRRGRRSRTARVAERRPPVKRGRPRLIQWTSSAPMV